MNNENKKKTTTKKTNTSVRKSATETTSAKKVASKKENVKKAVPKKETVNKVATQTTTRAKSEPQKNLNETVKVEQKAVKEVETEKNTNLKECVYCHKTFEKGYTICPHCHKRQKKNIGLIFFILCAVTFLFGIICFHFIEKYLFNTDNENDYKASCVLVDYENLVRHPVDYKGKTVRVIGTVVEVNGYDDGFGNNMEITINANQFDNGKEQLVTIDFSDKDYTQGFITGDLITVYGKYNSIDGNIPRIEAKYIVLGSN